MNLQELLTQWDTDKGKPFKDRLIDKAAYDKDPDDIGCMCAQGQVLHLIGGWSADQLMQSDQAEADKTTAELLGISITHAVLLRRINDQVDGAPAIVLTNPEQVLGDQAPTVLAFWRHLDLMSDEQWTAVGDVEWDMSWGAAWTAAGDAAGAAAWDAVWDAAWDAAGAVVESAAGAAARATNEIQGAAIMRAMGQPFYFLPMFGFADPQSII